MTQFKKRNTLPSQRIKVWPLPPNDKCEALKDLSTFIDLFDGSFIKELSSKPEYLNFHVSTFQDNGIAFLQCKEAVMND